MFCRCKAITRALLNICCIVREKVTLSINVSSRLTKIIESKQKARHKGMRRLSIVVHIIFTFC